MLSCASISDESDLPLADVRKRHKSSPMIIKNIFDTEPFDLPRLTVALGNFDGVHFAHTKLIKKAKEIASSLCTSAGEKILTAVFTFSDLKKPLITTTDEKLAIVVGTQILVLNSHPKLQFHLSSLEAAKTWSGLTLLSLLFPNCT